jgi:hypothetical protein
MPWISLHRTATRRPRVIPRVPCPEPRRQPGSAYSDVGDRPRPGWRRPANETVDILPLGKSNCCAVVPPPTHGRACARMRRPGRQPLRPMLRPHISRSTLASLVGGACVVAAVGCASPAPAGPAGTTQVRILQPAQSLNDAYRNVAPVVCKAAALPNAVTASSAIDKDGGDIPLQHDGAPRATVIVGRHGFATPLTYEFTAEESQVGEFRFEYSESTKPRFRRSRLQTASRCA